MIVAMTMADLSRGEGISTLIQLSVRCAVPILFVVFATSSLRYLYPNAFTNWLLRNRKYIGLSFAAAMAWQGLFILWMTTVFTEYYVNEVYLLRDAIEGTVGYLFLAAMVVTSFRATRKHMSPKAWRRLHLSGIYFLWAYAISVYWWNLFYYAGPSLVDHLFYWMGATAFAVRVAAWKSRHSQESEARTPLALQVPGIAIAMLGALAAALGWLWREPVSAFLLAPAWSANLELWLPYWPFEPFLPLFAIAIGAWLTTQWPAADQRPHP